MKRKYRMSDGKLIEVMERALIGANRDLTRLEDFGYTELILDDLEAERLAFAAMPTDVELSGQMGLATLNKNNKVKETIDYVMVEIMQRVKLAFGSETHPIYKSFGVKNIHNEPEGNLLFLLLRVHRRADQLIAQIGNGLTPAIVAMVQTKANEFVALVHAQEQAVEDRDAAVQARVEAGNALYAKLVKLADLGKRLWLNVDESKYNDYVIYPTEPPAQQVVENDVNMGPPTTFSITGVEANSPMQAENQGSNPVQAYFSSAPGAMPGAAEPFVTIQPGMAWEGDATACGFLAGEREYFNVYNPGPAMAHVVVTVFE
jgi:hypothetical protein